MFAKILSSLLLLSLLVSGLANTPHTHADDLHLPKNHECCPHFHFGSHSHKNCSPSENNGLNEPEKDHDDDAIYLDGSPQFLNERKENFCDRFLPLLASLAERWVIFEFLLDPILNSLSDIPKRPITSKPLSVLLCCYRC